MFRQKTWRVRVRRAIEDWVDVQADNALQAEQSAANMPQVLSVFGGSAMPGNKPVDRPIPAGVEDDGDD